MRAAGQTPSDLRFSVLGRIDRFRDRITLGIRDADGALVGFVGRCSPGAPPQTPKYLNTPTTPIYNKSRSLFGLGEQAALLRARATPVLVEGPLDAIAIERASSAINAKHAGLALCGTACTDRQASAALIGAPSKAVFMFDPDSAGQSALLNGYRHLHPRVEVQAIAPTSVGDPAAVFQSAGRLALIRQLEQAEPVVDVMIDRILQTWPSRQTGAEAGPSAPSRDRVGPRGAGHL